MSEFTSCFVGIPLPQKFIKEKKRLQKLLDSINWEFDITEVVIYGVDSTKIPQHQEKLIHIPVD